MKKDGRKMKKILLAICLILPLAFTTCLTFADELDEPIIEEDFPEYVDSVAINQSNNVSIRIKRSM